MKFFEMEENFNSASKVEELLTIYKDSSEYSFVSILFKFQSLITVRLLTIFLFTSTISIFQRETIKLKHSRV